MTTVIKMKVIGDCLAKIGNVSVTSILRECAEIARSTGEERVHVDYVTFGYSSDCNEEMIRYRMEVTWNRSDMIIGTSIIHIWNKLFYLVQFPGTKIDIQTL